MAMQSRKSTNPFILFIKIETNGLAKTKQNIVMQDNVQDWPELICIRYKIGKYIKQKQHVSTIQSEEIIILHETIQYSDEAVNIHNITSETCTQQGIAPHIALERFNDTIHRFNITTIVGHNSRFNTNVLLAEMIRSNVSIEALVSCEQIDIMTYHHTLPCKTLKYIYQHLYNGTFPHHQSILAIILCFAKLHTLHLGNQLSQQSSRSC